MRKMILCLFAAGILGAAAPAFASDHNRPDRGGIDVGALGQCFDRGSADCRGYARSGHAYGFATTQGRAAPSLRSVKADRVAGARTPAAFFNDEATDALCAVHSALPANLLSTKPMTVAGCTVVLRYVEEIVVVDNWLEQVGGPGSRFLSLVAAALGRAS